MAKQKNHFLGTKQSRIDTGMSLMIIGLFFLLLPLIVLWVTNGDGGSLISSTTFGFIGLSFFLSGSIIVSSVEITDSRD